MNKHIDIHKIKYISDIERKDRSIKTCLEALRTYPPKSETLKNAFNSYVPIQMQKWVKAQLKREGLLWS